MDDRDPPIKEQNYVTGSTVVDIGDHRIARGMTRRSFSVCPHHKLVYDEEERRIWCSDCEKNVEAFDAFMLLVKSFRREKNDIKQRLEKVREAEENAITSIAARNMDQAWRKRKTVPCCPHCHNGLFPEDFKNGTGRVSKSYEIERRRRLSVETKKLPPTGK